MYQILDHMSALADPTRCRMLLMLDQQELTVSELCAVLQMPQSSVSRHLKTLSDGGWVASRRDGTSRFYSMSGDDLDSGARRLWPLLRDQLAGTASVTHDQRRLRGVLARRRARSQQFFATAAREWDDLRRELFGDVFTLWALLGLVDPTLVVGDLGCGTGHLGEVIAPYVERVIAVDASADMLAAARERLGGAANVDVREGDLEALPIESAALDVAVLSLVLQYAPSPVRVLEEAARVLRDGGRLLVVDMLPHDREEYQRTMGHVWLGFSDKQITGWLTGAGFARVNVRALPADPDAKGPTLFAAIAIKTTRSTNREHI
ncbi:MAG: ArsR family transcriptional regulator [Candidatus Rokuibacteriota bacterium]|nr:MAG: ArsR family transcriptional regulator [Candidatus Rokubacteria bacterium]